MLINPTTFLTQLLFSLKNVDVLIQRYRLSNYWNFQTKVIIIISIYSKTTSYQKILQTFSAAGLLNVAIVQRENSTNFSLVYHNPFIKGESEFIHLMDPKDWSDAFPNKIKNLHGHQLNLLTVERPPGIMFKNQSVVGFQTRLIRTIMRKWNATYQFKKVHFLEFNGNCSVMTDLFINRIPFYSWTNTFEIVPANYQDQIRVMVRYKKSQSTFSYYTKYVLSQSRLLLNMTLSIYIVMYYILFYRKSPVFFSTGWRIIPIACRQPIGFKIKHDWERIFIIAFVWFAFFAIAAYETEFTSNLIAYYPERKIKSISELTEKNIKVFCDRFVFALLIDSHYNLPSDFLNKLQVVDDIAWKHTDRGPEYAYVVSMMHNSFFLKSAANLDSLGKSRFYLLDHIIATIPMVYSFMSKSPYKAEYRLIHNHIMEGGLGQYLLTKTLRKDVWKLWSYFRVYDERTITQHTQRTQIIVGCCLLCWGWIISLICLAVEILFNRFLGGIKMSNILLRLKCTKLKKNTKRVFKPKKFPHRRTIKKV